MKVSELFGEALDWAVIHVGGCSAYDPETDKPSTDWAQGGLIIEREWINITNENNVWTAEIADDVPDGYVSATGPNPLVAAMRCYVTSKLGDEVEIPSELLESV